ncbi:MAG: tol-pal system-associated acyl-CoA thioesterase [Alphaproteobacteria bacterium]|jgi:acyl-CoA thioester hydrolase|nr:tol-pal system-associated acyl-CoA thioesterase [Alphaproteobacteria bacterium]
MRDTDGETLSEALPAAGGDGLAGRFDGAQHRFPVRVYWEDTDGSGIMYHASYLRFAERARTEMLRLMGTNQGMLLAREGLAFPVRRAEVDFLSPAQIDDHLEVVTRVLSVRNATVLLEQGIRRGEQMLARLVIRLACVNRGGRPVRIPAMIKAAFGRLETAPA